MDCIDPALDVTLYNQHFFLNGSNFFSLKLSDIYEVSDIRHSISFKELEYSNVLINKWTRAA
jgi:hypothetical protein